MKKRTKNVKRKKSQPKQDTYLLRIRKGERLYKFYYFRPIAGRSEHFEYRILTKEKASGMLEMVRMVVCWGIGLALMYFMWSSLWPRSASTQKDKLKQLVTYVMVMWQGAGIVYSSIAPEAQDSSRACLDWERYFFESHWRYKCWPVPDRYPYFGKTAFKGS